MQGRDLAHVIFEKQNHDIRRHSNRRTFSRNRQCMMVWFLMCDCVNDLILYFVALVAHLCSRSFRRGPVHCHWQWGYGGLVRISFRTAPLRQQHSVPE